VTLENVGFASFKIKANGKKTANIFNMERFNYDYQNNVNSTVFTCTFCLGFVYIGLVFLNE